MWISNHPHQWNHNTTSLQLAPTEVGYLKGLVNKWTSRFNIIELLGETYPEDWELHYSGGKYHFQKKVLPPAKQELLAEKSELFKKKIIELMKERGYRLSRVTSEFILYFHPLHWWEQDISDNSTDIKKNIWKKFIGIFSR